MASGKCLKKPEPHYVKIFHNNGQPIKRKIPRERMSKKARIKKRWEGRERFGK